MWKLKRRKEKLMLNNNIVIGIDFEWEDIFFDRNKAEEKLKEFKSDPRYTITDSDIQEVKGKEGLEYRLWISWKK